MTTHAADLRYDLIIRGGQVLDGRGGAAVLADVAVRDGLIVAIGEVNGYGAEEIDARGKLVTPGFVDIHTHYDGQASWDRFLTPSSLHGVTTVVMGNCGVGFAPVKPADHDRIIELMEGVEDIPGTALHEGLAWTWSSFPEYLDEIEKLPHDIDLCAQLPHGALRLYVMGERALRHELATDDDMRRMRALVSESIRAGAFGVSTSRTMVHRSSRGDLTPSIAAAENELTHIALGIRDAGFGVLEAISDWLDERADDFAMFRRIVERSGIPCSISLMQDGNQPGRWREVLTQLEAARRDGLPMTGQVAPRAVGLVMTVESSVSPFQDCAAYASLKALSLADKLRTMRDPSFRALLLAQADALDRNPPADRKPTLSRHFERVYPLGDPLNYEPLANHSVAALAQLQGISPYAYFYDLMANGDGSNALYVPIFNYVDGNYEACREMLASSATLPGLGDAGAHVGTICDASFTTYLLTYWGRDRRAGRFDLGWLIKRLTSDTAHAVGLTDRGVLAPGKKADINVIDFARLRIEAPVMANDLPAGGKRFMQGAEGYDASIVSGVVIRRNGVATGATPGRLVRNGRVAE
ncbi:MAG: N-acyl-D-amino-acid deacylase family protein [Janthinobacterium lividum]